MEKKDKLRVSSLNKLENKHMSYEEYLDILVNSSISFEDAFDKLETLSSLQNDSSIKLEDSIENFKLAKALLKYCQDILEKVKLEVLELDSK